ncbi:MAG: protease III [Nitrospinae bacterium RIFCSPLOWO2_12_FULL_47_7]|nr:MAG: protease III [Nitrospinae bacterium RIFCSPLOWO2_12_FULL_47_7]
MRVRLVKLSVKALVVLLLVCFLGTADAAKRVTGTLVLKNGLAVLLEHDPDVHRSAAALAVGAGTLYDPPAKMGLAHYLEHMLFLGTKKYPEVESFKKYLSEHSGAANAYTADVTTNYFFQTAHEGFEGALDRFSGFFTEPLLDKKYAEREVNAVSSEHDKNILNDAWRTHYVEDQISEPGHPIRKFGTGNAETLAGDNQSALLDFYKKYYSATNMKLAILSNKSLKEQELLVRKYFDAIPSFPVQHPAIDSSFRKPLHDKYRFLKTKTIKDVRELSLSFPTIRLKDHQESKPGSIVAFLIGYEGEGSLLSQLKKEGLALGLSAGASFGHPNINLFHIGISLTADGVVKYERVLDLVFSYIQMLKERGIAEYTFKENQAMAQTDFYWKDPDEGMGHVSSKAALMFNFDIKDVETLPYLYRKYDPLAYKAVLDTLNPENMLVNLQTNTVKTDQKARFYDTEYSIAEVGGSSFDRLHHPRIEKELTYPEQNKFIPYNLAVEKEYPHLVRNDDIAKIWFKYDNRFKQPKIVMQLRIETPLSYDTVAHSALGMLYNAAVLEGINEAVYPIQMAGLSYGLSMVKEGMVLTVGGYSERISDLVHLVAHNLVSPKIDEQKFKNLKEAILHGLENKKLNQAYGRASYYSSLFWLQKQYEDEELINAIKLLTFKDLRQYEGKLYEKVFITGMVYGNWTEEKIQESVHILLDELKSRPLPENERFKQVITKLEPGQKVLFSKKVEDKNNALLYTLQAGPRDFKRGANILLTSSLIEADFFTQIRTNQQLGYVVISHPERIEDRLFLKFAIQSATYSPFEIRRRLEGWFDTIKELLANMSDEEFEKHRDGIIVSLEKEGDSIAEVARDLYYLATEEKGDFKRKMKLIDAVKNTSKKDVQAFALELLKDPGTPRSIMLIRSKSNEEPVQADVLTETSQLNELKTKNKTQ